LLGSPVTRGIEVGIHRQAVVGSRGKTQQHLGEYFFLYEATILKTFKLKKKKKK